MSGQKLKVLLLADSRSFHIERLVAQLRRQDCRVLLASLEHGVMHHFHLKPISSLRPLNYFLLNRQIKVIASRFRPNVIYAHFATGYGYAAARAVRGLKIPMVLNTSFNERGVPIACAPKNALSTFKNTALQYLAIGNYLVKKRDSA